MDEVSTMNFTKKEKNKLTIPGSHYESIYPTNQTIRIYSNKSYSQINEFKKFFATKSENKEAVKTIFDFGRTYPTDYPPYENHSVEVDPFIRLLYKNETVEMSNDEVKSLPKLPPTTTSIIKSYSKEKGKFRRLHFTKNANTEPATKINIDHWRTDSTENTSRS